MEIVLATRNRRKAEELRRMSASLQVDILTLDDFPGCPEVKEDGSTFRENAMKKALSVSECTGRAALADDSGLEVDALNGAPGTFSARYAGADADDRRNVEKLLQEMASKEDRRARFVCCIVLAVPGREPVEFYGFAEGTIGAEPRGDRGFGYDPVFFPAGHIRTFAEMLPEEKDFLSHRGKALREIIAHLKSQIPTGIRSRAG
jgi:XTP/dITP diphosphohydrolase